MNKTSDEPYDGIRDYTLLAITALIVMALSLAQMRAGTWSLVPCVLGILSLLFRWRIGPLLVLLSLIVLVIARTRGMDPVLLAARFLEVILSLMGAYPSGASGLQSFPQPIRSRGFLTEALLTGATLVYCASAYRLLSMTVRLFPPPPRRPRVPGVVPPKNKRSPEMDRRAPECVSLVEGLALLLWLTVITVCTLLFALWLRRQTTDLTLLDSVWRGLLAIWLLGGGALIAATLIKTWGERRQSPEEARVFLQDVAWRETRREQGRLVRWLTWARRKRRQEDL